MKQSVSAKQDFLDSVLKKGEFYAGIVLGKKDEPDYHLIGVAVRDTGMNWNDNNKWAESVGGKAPDRRELGLLRVNALEHFKDEAYWSGEQHASYSYYAWYQSFNDGDQDYNDKGSKLRGVAVRRLEIL